MTRATPLVAEIVRMYNDDRTYGTIATATGIRRERVRGILIGAGMPLYGKWRKRPLPPVAEITERYAAGESIGALARTYREAWDCMAGILDGTGVTIRGHGEAERIAHSRRTPEEHDRWARAAREGREAARSERNGNRNGDNLLTPSDPGQ